MFLIRISEMTAAIAQLGERQTEDLKVPGSIPGEGMRRVIIYFYTHTLQLTCLCGAMDNASLS